MARDDIATGGYSRAHHVVSIPTVIGRPRQDGGRGPHIHTDHAVPRMRAHAAFRASAWSVGLAGGHGGGRICLREGVGAAQCIGRPVPAGHVPDQVRRVGCGHPGGGDEQRAYRGSAHDRHRVGGRMEPGPGHAGHRDAELGVSLGLLARALTGIPAIWSAVGGVSPAPSPSRAPQAGSGASARSSGGPEHRGQSSCSRRHANA